MAKLALIEREKKRASLAKKFAPKRAALKAVINDFSKSDEEHFEARLALQQLPLGVSVEVEMILKLKA